MYSVKGGQSSLQKVYSFESAIREAKKPLVGAALTIPSPYVAQIVAERPECDFVFIDMEHSPLSPESTTHLVHAVASASNRSGHPCHSLVRVPSAGVEWLKWALDSGASGIIIPMTNSATEAGQIVDRALYPPRGRRSFGPTMASFAQPTVTRNAMDYFERAQNGYTSIFPMIESEEGLSNVESIMAVDGISGVFVGPFDLRLALGLPGALDGNEPEFTQAMKRICMAGKQFGKIVGGMGVGAEMSAKRADEGLSFLVAGADMAILGSSVSASLLESHKGVEEIIAERCLSSL